MRLILSLIMSVPRSLYAMFAHLFTFLALSFSIKEGMTAFPRSIMVSKISSMYAASTLFFPYKPEVEKKIGC